MLHALKTGLAAAIATAVYMAFQLPYGYWAVVSAVVVMQASLGGSIKASWARVIGTAIGGLVGALAATAAMAIAPQWLGKPGVAGVIFTTLAAGLTVGATSVICVVLRLDEALRLAGVTCSIVLLAFAKAPWTSAMHRTIDVVIGVAVAVLVSLAVLPARARRKLGAKLAEVVEHAGTLCGQLAEAYQVRDYDAAAIERVRDSMKIAFRDCRGLVKDMDAEPGSGGAAAVAAHEVFRGVERVLSHVLALDQAARTSDRLPDEARAEPREDELHRQAAPEVRALVEAIRQGATEIAACLGVWRTPAPTLPAIDKGIQALDGRMAELRSGGASRHLPLDEVMRFYQFVQALKELGRDLTATAALVAAAGRADEAAAETSDAGGL